MSGVLRDAIMGLDYSMSGSNCALHSIDIMAMKMDLQDKARCEYVRESA